MSKSKGKIFTISDLEEKGFDALDYRYFCLTTHYRKQLVFSLDKLKSAKNSYQRLKNIVSELEDGEKENKKYLKEFEKAMNDDLNTPKALQVLWKLVRDENAKGKVKTIKKMDEVFGLDLFKEEKVKIPKDILEKVKEREKAREEKDWKKADKLRDEIQKKGFVIDDTDEGTRVRKE